MYLEDGCDPNRWTYNFITWLIGSGLGTAISAGGLSLANRSYSGRSE